MTAATGSSPRAVSAEYGSSGESYSRIGDVRTMALLHLICRSFRAADRLGRCTGAPCAQLDMMLLDRTQTHSLRRKFWALVGGAVRSDAAEYHYIASSDFISAAVRTNITKINAENPAGFPGPSGEINSAEQIQSPYGL